MGRGSKLDLFLLSLREKSLTGEVHWTKLIVVLRELERVRSNRSPVDRGWVYGLHSESEGLLESQGLGRVLIDQLEVKRDLRACLAELLV